MNHFISNIPFLIVLVGICPVGICPGGICLGGICPDTMPRYMYIINVSSNELKQCESMQYV